MRGGLDIDERIQIYLIIQNPISKGTLILHRGSIQSFSLAFTSPYHYLFFPTFSSPIDYLLYGCMHVPTSRLDALFTTRLSPTWQFFATAISLAPKTFPSSSSISDLNHPTSNGLIAGPTNLQMTLQRDTGKWCTEYSYSADDSLWGFRFLHNFGFGGTTISGKENSSSSASPFPILAHY